MYQQNLIIDQLLTIHKT